MRRVEKRTEEKCKKKGGKRGRGGKRDQPAAILEVYPDLVTPALMEDSCSQGHRSPMGDGWERRPACLGNVEVWRGEANREREMG